MSRTAVALLFPIVIIGCASSVVLAQVDEAAAHAPAAAVGSARDWLDLQKSGTAASQVARPLPGELADRSFQRYADSFSQPIPETLTREEFLSDGGGGGK